MKDIRNAGPTGAPNWKQSKTYGDTGSWTDDRWAREFGLRIGPKDETAATQATQKFRLEKSPGSDDSDLTHRRSVFRKKDYMHAEFDLAKPADPQFRAARAIFSQAQKTFVAAGGSVVTNRNRRVAWLNFLRVLDGRASGAGWRNIGRYVFPRSSAPAQEARKAFIRALKVGDRLCR